MKNKMKKIFSKITVLALLVATLIPYTSIPKAEAATEPECNGDWTYYTNYYFFLQAEHPYTWVNYLANDYNGDKKSDGKVTTRYFTSFLYNFPVDGSTIVFDEENSGFVKIYDSVEYQEDFNAGTTKNRKSWSAGQFFYEWDIRTKDMTSHFDGNLSSYAYKTGEGNSEEDRIVYYLFHGDWAYLGANSESENIVWDLNEINVSSDGVGFADIKDQVNASILINRNDASITQAKIGAGVIDEDLRFDMGVVRKAIINYNNGVGEGSTVTEGKDKNGNGIDQPVIKMIIERNYEIKDVFTINQPSNLRIGEGNVHYATYAGAEYALNSHSGLENAIADGETLSYVNTNNNNEIVEVSDIKATKSDNIVWFIAPTLYQMSYKVCKDSGSEEGKVTLSYDANKPEKVTAEAKNIPSKETKDEGSDFTIPETKPELSGYKFKEWNISPKCDSTGYEAGYTLEDLTNDTTLYACWVSTSGTNNGKTGVLTYTGLFTGIIALAGGSYYIMKKKNLFRQI